MVNIATGKDFEEEEAAFSDITESAFFAPAFFEPWFDAQNGVYTDERTGEVYPLREQWFAGGRGCVDGETLISTPNGEVKIKDFKGGEVFAFDGEKIRAVYACRPRRYTKEEIFEVKTEDGRSILVTDEHRFLTPCGWKMTKELRACDDVCLSRSTRHAPTAPSQDGKVSRGSLETHCAERQAVSLGDVRRLTRTVLNCLYRYWHDSRPYDAQPLSEGETYRDVFQGLADALEHTRSSHTGDSGLGGICTRCVQYALRRSKRGSLRRSSDKCCGETESRIAALLSEWLSAFFPSAVLSQTSADPTLRILEGLRLALKSTENRDSSADGLCEVSSSEQTDALEVCNPQMLSRILGRRVLDESFSDTFPSLVNEDCLTRNPHYIKYGKVVSIKKVKEDYYYDMFVPEYNNYVANGFVNHNSTKSSYIAAALVLMLEQDWQAALDRRYGLNGQGLGPSHNIPDPKWYRHITNAICYRKVAATLADSIYNQFSQTMGDYMGEAITDHWVFKKSPLRIVHIDEEGNEVQEIMFRGLDDPLKSKSIKPHKGYFKYLWLEELAEFDGMEEIRNVRQSILRGGKKFLSLYSYNPPETSSNWVNDEALKPTRGRKVYHPNYLSVPREWLGDDFFVEANLLKERNYRAYRHEYLGEVTGNGGSIFPNLIERVITDEEISHFDNLRYGVDFGFALDPAAFIKLHYDSTRRRLIAIDEIYETNLMNDELAAKINAKKNDFNFVTCDSAEPKSIAELQRYGVNCLAAVKGPDSVRAGIKFLQSLCSIECDRNRTPNFYNEFNKYEYEKNKSGEFISRYPDKLNHLIDACLTGDTIVYTEGGRIRISELVGTSGELLAFNEETGSAEVVRFCNVRKTRTDARTLRVSVDRCGFVDCTDDHRILTNNGYVEAGLLKVGTMVRCVGGYRPVTSIVENEKREDVFDLEVPTLHNFFVNRGVCVHNCRYAMENDMMQGGLF